MDEKPRYHLTSDAKNHISTFIALTRQKSSGLNPLLARVGIFAVKRFQQYTLLSGTARFALLYRIFIKYNSMGWEKKQLLIELIDSKPIAWKKVLHKI